MSELLRALVFANGDLNPGPMVSRALAEAGPGALAIGVDGGARHLLALGLRPHAVIGDMDSVPEDLLAQCRTAGAAIVRHPAAKDENDLELALLYAAGEGAAWIRVIAALGDRLDQTLANVLLLTLPALRGCDMRLVAGRQMAWLLRPGAHRLAGAAGDTLSLIPIGGDAQGITTGGLSYPLRAEPLRSGPARGISNVFSSPEVMIRLEDGLLLAVHTLGRA